MNFERPTKTLCTCMIMGSISKKSLTTLPVLPKALICDSAHGTNGFRIICPPCGKVECQLSKCTDSSPFIALSFGQGPLPRRRSVFIAKERGVDQITSDTHQHLGRTTVALNCQYEHHSCMAKTSVAYSPHGSN